MKILKTTALIGLALTSSLFASSKVFACSPEPYIGSICMFGGNFAIRNFALAQGQLLAINQNQALFSILGTTYGGDGRTTFALPDLRGRSAVGFGSGPGLRNVQLGEKGGAQEVFLTLNNLPSHSHTATTTVEIEADFSASSAILRAVSGRAETNSPTGAVLADSPRRENIYSSGAPGVDMGPGAIELVIDDNITATATTTISNAGNNVPINIRSPYIGVNYQIALFGLFPPRN